MTWLQFIASIVGTVAWPVVMAWGLFLFRNRIGEIFRRPMREIHFPGGGKVIFEKALEAGSEAVKQIEKPEQKQITYAPPKEMDPAVRILQGYAEVEETLHNIREGLKMAPIYGPSFTLDVLKSRQLIGPEVLQLFASLRAARNSVAHGRLQPTDIEADEYVRQAEMFREVLKVVASVAEVTSSTTSKVTS